MEILILVLITIGYILNYWLRKNNKITQIDRLKFWDSIFLVSAIVTAISAIILFLLGEGIRLVDINMLPIHKNAGAVTILLMLLRKSLKIPPITSKGQDGDSTEKTSGTG